MLLLSAVCCYSLLLLLPTAAAAAVLCPRFAVKFAVSLVLQDGWRPLRTNWQCWREQWWGQVNAAEGGGQGELLALGHY